MDLALANLVVAAALAGLIATIQLVQYPLFALVGASEWSRYGAEHRRRITWLAAPLMSANVGLALALLVDGSSTLRVVNAGLAVGAFALTGLVFAPMHGRLEREASERAVRLLVRTNWLRTVIWAAQVVVAVAIV
ncbi:hypothetical protein OJ997_29735 [Solirubrobacter phytolaccae]|uniref:DUF1772 domain-containing protein n=1 Tax=Solirubrobacter phytolaccae TaxID=1404360 RepID=A0A9X3SCD2_9ACTN|nr:hypothetical protein [Solirubrobacter phytolaccae]MDA0184521.1 hypothetical protein [Solirubrobacter phytolaccae]